MKNVPVDLTGATAERIEGGTLYHLNAEAIYAKPARGSARQLTREGTAHVNTVRRNAENHIRRKMGLMPLPRMCAVCGVEATESRDAYCSMPCRVQRGRGHRGATAFDWDFLTPEEREAKLSVVREAYDARPVHAYTPQGPAKSWYSEKYGGRDIQAGLRLADALIVAKGGTVPRGMSYEQYAYAYEAAKLPTSETA